MVSQNKNNKKFEIYTSHNQNQNQITFEDKR